MNDFSRQPYPCQMVWLSCFCPVSADVSALAKPHLLLQACWSQRPELLRQHSNTPCRRHSFGTERVGPSQPLQLWPKGKSSAALKRRELHCFQGNSVILQRSLSGYGFAAFPSSACQVLASSLQRPESPKLPFASRTVRSPRKADGKILAGQLWEVARKSWAWLRPLLARLAQVGAVQKPEVGQHGVVPDLRG